MIKKISTRYVMKIQWTYTMKDEIATQQLIKKITQNNMNCNHMNED